MDTYDINTQPKTDDMDKPKAYISKLIDTISISRAEYEMLLRDKTQLDMILRYRLDKTYSLEYLIDAILKMRGMAV